MRRFAKVFAELEARLPSLGVAEYGVSCTTLEDVFLRINEHKLLRLAQAETLAPATLAGPGCNRRC